MKFRQFPAFFLSLMLAACGGEAAPEAVAIAAANNRPLIVTSNYPLYYFAREIAGDSARVIFPAMEGDPANWKPDSEAIAQMQSANLIVLNGAAYESWLNWVSLPEGILLDTTAGIRDRLIPLNEEAVHQHGPAGEHSHKGLAFTVWLDPGLAIEQARAIEQAISELLPQNQASHRARLNGLEARLLTLDQELQAAFEELGAQALLFSHPVYQYLIVRYGLNGASVHWEPGRDPGIKGWIDFRKTLRNHPAHLMLWEDQPIAETADTLLQLGVQSIPFHTASNLPAGSDYFEVMNENIRRLNSH